MQPTPNVSPVPSIQRLGNGAFSGMAAQLVGNGVTGVLMQNGLDPTTAAVLGTAAGSGVSGVLATIGDLARGAMERTPRWWLKTLLQLPARIG